MAEATKTTKQVEKVIYEDKDVVNVTMSSEEANAVYSALWLMEMANMNDPSYIAVKDVQNAIGVVLNFPIAKFRFDTNAPCNSSNSVYIYSRG